MTTGLIGRMTLPAKVRIERQNAAREEVKRIARIMEEEPIGIQVGIVDDNMPRASFQIFQGLDRSYVRLARFVWENSQIYEQVSQPSPRHQMQ